ncbi:Golgi to ER traffic- protein [Puccinia graminis f. sp. tritici]|uniref:Golgi to ER traffic-protein n=1 Tax=Puccinia graminis f. sp. tritici TaxID=56615 RepID=A0A5B0QED0_PUCGR|nr:Golgi to ER traffic- protein [Puccinia graminis f. sp. tritici]
MPRRAWGAPCYRPILLSPTPFNRHPPLATKSTDTQLEISLASSCILTVHMAHDTSNASSPHSDPLPADHGPPFSLPEDIPSSISEGHIAIKDGVPFKRPQPTGKDLQEKTSSSAATGDKTVKRPEEWKVPPPKRLARVVNAHAKIVSPLVQRLDKPGKSKPTPDEFRSTGRDGAALDPALSADEEDVNVADEEETGSRSSALINKMKSLIKETPKKALKKKTANKSNPLRLGSMDVDPPVTDKHQASTHARGGSMPLTKFDSQGLKSSSAGQKTPKDKMPAKRSDKMHIDPPALAKLKATFAIPAASTANQLQEPAANPSTPARMENVNKYPAGLTRRGPETTPGNPGHLTRTPSTATTISNAVLPNLAKASLADMKAMRGIWIRDKENAAANVSELRRAGHHLIAPAAYEYQDRHLRRVTRFCSQLDRKIEESERTGLVEEIEVIDLTEEPDDPTENSVVGVSGAKRPMEGSSSMDVDDSPVESKKARTSGLAPVKIDPPNLGPYGFRSIPDKDAALAGLTPRFPVNKQPTISEFISQSNPSLMQPLPMSNPPLQPTMGSSSSLAKGKLTPVVVINSSSAANLRSTPASSHSTAPENVNLSSAQGMASTSSLVAASTLVPALGPSSLESSSTSNIHVSAPSGPQTSKKSSHPSAASKSKEVRSSQRVTRGSSGTSKPTSASKSKDVISNTPVPPATKDVAPASTDVPPATDDVPPATKDLPANSTLNISDQRSQGGQSINAPSALPPSGRVLPNSTLPEKSKDAQNKDKDVVDEGVDELEELSDKEEAPKKRGGKGKGKAQKKTPKTPKPPKTPRLKVSEMTPEQKLERDRKVKQRKEEKDNCVYAIPPQPGALLAPMWPPLTCEEARIAHKDMLVKSRNPHWNYGPELMDRVAKIVKAFGDDFEDDEFYTKMDNFKPDLEAIQAFGLVYKDELVQVDAADPFFKEGVVDLSMIKAAHDSDDKVKASSWQCLYGMMIRTDEHSDYTEDPHTVKAIDSSFRKIHTLTQSCFDHFHHYVLPSNKPVCDTSATWKQDTMFQSGEFVLAKIKALKAGAQGTASHGNKRTGNGLMILQKRIWETLFCCLMMQQALFLDDLDHCIKTKSFPNKTMVVSQYMTAEDRSKSLFKTGDVKDLKDSKALIDWGQDRLAAFGSMAIFFLYGAAGWWQCLTDSHNYNQKDVWALVYIAEAKADWLYNNGHYHERTPQDTPWYRIDGFVRWLLHKTNMHLRLTATTDTVDCQAAPRFWNQHVTEQTIARLALQDILAEVCSKSPRKSLNFNGEAAPDVVDAMTSQPGPGEDEGEANGGGEGEANGGGEDEEAANGGGEDEEDPNETQEEGGFIRPSHSGRSENSFATRRGGSPQRGFLKFKFGRESGQGQVDSD